MRPGFALTMAGCEDRLRDSFAIRSIEGASFMSTMTALYLALG